MTYKTANHLNDASAPEAEPILDRIRMRVDECHKVMDDLHVRLDRVVGISEGPSGNVPHAIPNGFAEETLQKADDLTGRFSALLSRIRRIV